MKRIEGIWQQGHWLHKVDEEISKPIFKLELGEVEHLIVTFGTWFGTPLTSLALAPFVIEAAASKDPTHWLLVAMIYSAFGVWWYDIARESIHIMRDVDAYEEIPLDRSKKGFFRAILPMADQYGRRIGLAALITSILSSFAAVSALGGHGARMARLYVVSWLATVSVVLTMKDTFLR